MPPSPHPTRPVRRRGRAAVAALALAAVVALAGPAGAVEEEAPPGPEVTATTTAPEGTTRAGLEATTTVLTASATSVVLGDPVTVTATVTPAATAVVEGGTVDFLVGGTSLGTAVVGPTGEATRNVTLARAGGHALTAAFAGTVDAEASTSAPLAITVTAPVTPPPTPTEPTDPGAARGTGTGVGPGGQTLTVTPNEGLDPAGTQVTVTGTGYTAAAGFAIATEGMYVALCVDKGPGVAPSPCVGGVDMSGTSGSSKWVTNAPYDGVPPGSVAAVDPDGSFSAELTVVAADEFVDCLDLPAGQRCVLATRMDHRASADRSQDVKVALCWEGQAACTTDPIPPADPDDPGDTAFTGYQLDPLGGSRATGGGLADTGPELRPLPWGIALLGAGIALVLTARRLARPSRSIRPVPRRTPAMTTARAPRPWRLAALLAAALGATSVTVVALGALTPAPVGAAPGQGTGSAGQTLTVSDVDDLDPAGTSVTVTGAGFDAEAGFNVSTMGLYLSVCVDNGPGQVPTPCIGGVDQSGETATSRWITNNPIGEAEAVPINASGEFTTTLLVTGQDANTSCSALAPGKSCKIVTRADHRGSGNRSQDVKVSIDFVDRRTASESFVTAALTDFLRTEPTDQQVATGVGQLAQQGKATYLRNLSRSDAWLTAVVNKLYQDTLGRDADAAGRTFWVGELRSGRRTVASVAAQFYASGEYFRGIGGNTVGSWVDDLYEKILLRAPDPSGRAYWISEVAAKARPSVALRMYQSGESARTRVKALYQSLLGRAADAEGLSYWAGRVVRDGDLALAVFLAGSGEYQSRAVTRFP